ncbi:MAG: hypothetical protein ACLFO1_07105 [Spirochaetaceae bacterium]
MKRLLRPVSIRLVHSGATFAGREAVEPSIPARYIPAFHYYAMI